MHLRLLTSLACLVVAPAFAVLQSPLRTEASGPTVSISEGTYVGYSQPVDGQAVDFFLGMRYARPPLGSLRFKKPMALSNSSQTRTAIEYGDGCLQGSPRDGFSEDCLYLNLIRPSRRTSYGKLPVMVFFHGGGFQYGTGNNQNGSRIVAESVKLNAPVIFVAINYRLGVFGFLGGSSVLSAARAGSATLNAGMYDTRMALQWVQAHISAFGGDPRRVTIAGQSAGAFIVGNNLLAQGGNVHGLFQGAIMESGSPGSASTLRPTHPKLDETFAKISQAVKCPTRPKDLSCLKSVTATSLLAAANIVTYSFAEVNQKGLLPFMPVQDFLDDGFWFSAQPRVLINRGKFSTVPIISGCNLDEGTGGAPHNLNTNADFEDWVREVAVINTANTTLVNRVLRNIFQLFPDDVTKGSPFPNQPNAASAGTTDLKDPFFPPSTNQFKRAAAFYGAWRYIGPHRQFLTKRYAAKSSGIWSYNFAQQDKQVLPYLGATHSSELTYVFGNTTDYPSAGFYAPLSKTIQQAYISFVNYRDPRKIGNLNWPPYTASGLQALQLKGGATQVIKENFRSAQLAYIKSSDAATVFSS
ncbi:hypothetical protein CF319_g2552 [Tilletia indica]|nr:hypothetical protein CF319_g2552 [Tilletia indica]